MSACRTADGKPKIRYDTRADAKRAARRWADGPQPYRCRVCGYFHLGHYPTDPDARAGLRGQHHPKPERTNS